MGGTRRLDTNGQANLILLCQPCHSRVESQRDWARKQGLLVRQYETPSDVPLTWHGCRVRLYDDGSVQHQTSVGAPTLISGSATEPSYAELRARNLLAQSLINHRRTDDGLSRRDLALVLDALRGQLDVEVA